MTDNYQDYRKMARDVSSRGRYGDTMLMHVNPLEVELLNQAHPGSVTTNPDTGQPEAFFPLLLAALAAPAVTAAVATPVAIGIGTALTAAATAAPVVAAATAAPIIAAGTAAPLAAAATAAAAPIVAAGTAAPLVAAGTAAPAIASGAPIVGAAQGALASTTAIPTGGGLAGTSGLLWGAPTAAGTAPVTVLGGAGGAGGAGAGGLGSLGAGGAGQGLGVLRPELLGLEQGVMPGLEASLAGGSPGGAPGAGVLQPQFMGPQGPGLMTPNAPAITVQPSVYGDSGLLASVDTSMTGGMTTPSSVPTTPAPAQAPWQGPVQGTIEPLPGPQGPVQGPVQGTIEPLPGPQGPVQGPIQQNPGLFDEGIGKLISDNKMMTALALGYGIDALTQPDLAKEQKKEDKRNAARIAAPGDAEWEDEVVNRSPSGFPQRTQSGSYYT